MAPKNDPSRCAAGAAIFNFLNVEQPSKQGSSSLPAQKLPTTTPERLAESACDLPAGTDSANTVLYVAYGSNLSAEKFLGDRGIRPLSKVNVSIPTLELTFNLPGTPYIEPCFANVDYRKVPKTPPKIPDVPKVPPFEPPASQAAAEWEGGLIGVAYEVTREDYSTIIRTEGGGAGYLDIIVPCVPLPPNMSVPEKPFPSLPKPFLAHTLYVPYIPRDKLPDDPGKKHWYQFLEKHLIRELGYAEPSARYLKLITDGAYENELPEAYQKWLLAKRPYTATSWRQKLAATMFSGVGLFVRWIMMNGSKGVADKDGKFPKWVGAMVLFFFSVLWLSYDYVLKPLFGDGERTIEPDGEKMQPRRFPSADEEKASLLLRDW